MPCAQARNICKYSKLKKTPSFHRESNLLTLVSGGGVKPISTLVRPNPLPHSGKAHIRQAAPDPISPRAFLHPTAAKPPGQTAPPGIPSDLPSSSSALESDSSAASSVHRCGSLSLSASLYPIHPLASSAGSCMSAALHLLACTANPDQ